MDKVIVVDAALYDTEVVDPMQPNPRFFVSSRAFAVGGAPKTHKVHTNLIGSGSTGLPAGYCMIAKSLVVELDNLAESDKASVENAILDLHLGGKVVERVKVGYAIEGITGSPFSTFRKLEHGVPFRIDWSRTPEVSSSFSMRVSMLGVMWVPSVDDDEETKARAKEAYGRKRLKEPPVLLVWVHLDCVEPTEALIKGPLTRRACEAIRISSLNARGTKSGQQRDTRRAWWCDRCGEKVKQSDKVAAVKVRS